MNKPYQKQIATTRKATAVIVWKYLLSLSQIAIAPISAVPTQPIQDAPTFGRIR